MICRMCHDRPAVYMVHSKIRDREYYGELLDFSAPMCVGCYCAFIAGRDSDGILECEGL